MTLWNLQRGAAAVEFALVLPVLLLIMVGTVEFGRAYNAQISLTHAARETARDMAINHNWTKAQAAGRAAATSLQPSSMSFTTSSATCPKNTTVSITITYPLPTVTGLIDDLTLTSKAAMRCGG